MIINDLITEYKWALIIVFMDYEIVKLYLFKHKQKRHEGLSNWNKIYIIKFSDCVIICFSYSLLNFLLNCVFIWCSNDDCVDINNYNCELWLRFILLKFYSDLRLIWKMLGLMSMVCFLEALKFCDTIFQLIFDNHFPWWTQFFCDFLIYIMCYMLKFL